MRGSESLPQLSAGSRVSTEMRIPSTENMSNLGLAAEPVQKMGHLPKSVLKQPSVEIAAYIEAQKALPEFEKTTLITTDSKRPPSTMHEPVRTSISPGKPRKIEGSAPEMADVIYENQMAKFDPEPTLTGRMMDEKISPDEVRRSTPRVVSGELNDKKLKGTGPEMAGIIVDQQDSAGMPDDHTSLTNYRRANSPTNARVSINQGNLVSSTPSQKEPVYQQPPDQEITAAPIAVVASAPQSRPKSGTSEIDLKGAAPDVASSIVAVTNENQPDDTTLTNHRRVGSEQAAGNMYNGTVVNSEYRQSVNLKDSAPEIAGALATQKAYPAHDNVTLTDNSAYKSNVPRTGDIQTGSFDDSAKSSKLKGTAPELAAQLKENDRKYNGHTNYETTLTDTGKIGQRKDVNDVQPTFTKTQHSQRPVDSYVDPINPQMSKVQHAQRPESGYVISKEPSTKPTRSQKAVTDDSSSVDSDGEYYIVVGKSQYYLDRKKSLRARKSRPYSRHNSASRKERSTHRSGSSSSGSTISSINSRDRRVSVDRYRRRQGAGRNGVDAWLNGNGEVPILFSC